MDLALIVQTWSSWRADGRHRGVWTLLGVSGLLSFAHRVQLGLQKLDEAKPVEKGDQEGINVR